MKSMNIDSASPLHGNQNEVRRRTGRQFVQRFLSPHRTFVWVAIAILATSGTAIGQNNRTAKKDDLKPRLETLKTRDGVPLACGYFPSDKGKEAVPVVIIHHWKGSAPPFLPLAEALQKAGCAVITPDLRGHGMSNKYMDVRGTEQEFNFSRMNRKDVGAMINVDLETVKKFLREENDDEKLNLNALTLVGIGEGAILAANYAVVDWNFPDVSSKKQSKDVRAIVAISPARTVEGFKYDIAARHPLVSRLPWLIVVGGDSPQASEAERLHGQLDRLRLSGGGFPVELKTVASNLSDDQLVRGSKEVIPAVVDFVKSQVIENQKNFPWISRKGN